MSFVCDVHACDQFFSDRVIVGSQDGRIHVWSADTGEEMAILDGGHPHPSHCVQFNPRLMMMASACRSLVGKNDLMQYGFMAIAIGWKKSVWLSLNLM